MHPCIFTLYLHPFSTFPLKAKWRKPKKVNKKHSLNIAFHPLSQQSQPSSRVFVQGLSKVKTSLHSSKRISFGVGINKSRRRREEGK